MKSVKIGTNATAANISKSKHQVSQIALNQAKILASELIPLETLENDIELFKQSFVGYLHAFISKDKVLKYVDTSNLIEWNSLTALQNRYKEYKQPGSTNFDIFATTEYQVNCYEYSLKLCDHLNSHPQQIDLRHHLRNTIIPLVEIDGETFIPDSIAISMLK